MVILETGDDWSGEGDAAVFNEAPYVLKPSPYVVILRFNDEDRAQKAFSAGKKFCTRPENPHKLVGEK